MFEKNSLALMEQGINTDQNAESKGEPQAHNATDIATNETDVFKAKLAELEQRCNDLQDQFLRARADLDNARKRFIRDKEDLRSFTVQSVLGEIINVFDAFQIGLINAEQSGISPDTANGFQMILQQFKASLDKLGVTSIEPQEESFNPYFHEAVSTCYNDSVLEGYVVHTVRNGYRLGDKLLRPASVVVSKGKMPEESPKDH
ncbi:MAG: nucleotide exchange factor GrpE [Puniceicoccales bacterium]|jgi:molecular chaperone GrpE|nr:nucleotide exchange factor GrpE [Puniceicoccales bacterium]